MMALVQTCVVDEHKRCTPDSTHVPGQDVYARELFSMLVFVF